MHACVDTIRTYNWYPFGLFFIGELCHQRNSKQDHTQTGKVKSPLLFLLCLLLLPALRSTLLRTHLQSSMVIQRWKPRKEQTVKNYHWNEFANLSHIIKIAELWKTAQLVKSKSTSLHPQFLMTKGFQNSGRGNNGSLQK